MATDNGQISLIFKVMKKFTFLLILIIFSSCSFPKALKPAKGNKDIPVNALERARQNVNEGRGVSLKGLASGGSTSYEFSTSNPLWRASLETIDFMPFTTVDYSGGIIITDWYNDGINDNNSIKITIRFLSNVVRSDSIKIIVHNKKCKIESSCAISEIDSNIKFELQKTILAKAAQLELASKKSKK